jgi:asparagine synthase (glutamine-hydrolysing)
MASGSAWVFGTNRLAIVSSQDSKQPIDSSNREITLAFNGEIYNYKSFWRNDELRINRACDDGDGPTVAEVLAIRGEGAIRDLDGMFALLWVDHRSSVLYAARDRVGIKPLYYAWADDRVLFASELKSLVAEETVHEVQEVEPGTVLALRISTTCRPVFLRERRYFDFRESRSPREPGELLQALDESVKLQCAYSGRIGVYLSGGVDSGGIYGLAKRHAASLVPLILTRSGGPDGEFAIRQSKELGDDPVIGRCPSEYDLFSSVRETIRVSESFEPNVVRQSSIQLHIAKLAVLAGVKVVLCGEGADELFCGYPDFLNRCEDWQDLRLSFLQGLERTQLQRVDRASMSLTTEVRVPYLCNDVIEIALSIYDRDEFILEGAEPGRDNKRCLRAALAGLIPDWVRLRPKVVLSEGLGLGSNHPSKGMFSQFVHASITESHFLEIQMQFSEWHLKSPEEAYYFSIFEDFKYSKAKFMTRRVRANLVPSISSPL